MTAISNTLAATIDDLNLTVESLPNSFKALQVTLQDFDNQSKDVLKRFDQHEKAVSGEFDKLKVGLKKQNEENLKIIEKDLDTKMDKLGDDVKELITEQMNKKSGILSVFRGGKS